MRLFKRSSTPQELGSLETQVMEVVWARGESNVRDVAEQLERPLAYTTVMTTLDRLYKKGLLERRKAERAFHYSARLSRHEWTKERAGQLVAGFLTGPQPAGATLISCFLDTVGHDAALLDELERKIKLKRRELKQEKS